MAEWTRIPQLAERSRGWPYGGAAPDWDRNSVIRQPPWARGETPLGRAAALETSLGNASAVQRRRSLAGFPRDGKKRGASFKGPWGTETLESAHRTLGDLQSRTCITRYHLNTARRLVPRDHLHPHVAEEVP